MFIHSVYFRLRDDLSPGERTRFEEGHIGTPAGTNRSIIDRDYTHALILAFADEGAHDAYQAHPVHDRFRDACAGYWSGIRIFDTITTA